jgi:hypothetical protein
MSRHRHILVPHCIGRQDCKWLVCFVCNWYGDDPAGRWVHNPYEFTKEPKPNVSND